MTWMGASPVLIVCFIFDALRFLFEQFWLLGPALAGIYCATQTSDIAVIGELLTKGCLVGASALGYFGGPALVVFGTVMAMAVGLFGWLTVGLMLLMTNARIFKQHPSHSLWLVISLLISEIPLIGSIPALTITVGKMYHTQIKTDKEALKKHRDANAAAQLQERQQQAAELMQARVAQQAEMEATNAAMDVEEMGDEEIPDEVRKTT